MIHPLLFPILGFFVFLLAIFSYAFPNKAIGKIHEYFKFLLVSIGSFWALYIVGWYITDYRWDGLFMSDRWLFILLFVWITLFHLFYPFKTVERNRLLTVISLSIVTIIFILTLIAWIGMR